jgi:hypothetical protein
VIRRSLKYSDLERMIRKLHFISIWFWDQNEIVFPTKQSWILNLTMSWTHSAIGKYQILNHIISWPHSATDKYQIFVIALSLHDWRQAACPSELVAIISKTSRCHNPYHHKNALWKARVVYTNIALRPSVLWIKIFTISIKSCRSAVCYNMFTHIVFPSVNFVAEQRRRHSIGLTSP